MMRSTSVLRTRRSHQNFRRCLLHPRSSNLVRVRKLSYQQHSNKIRRLDISVQHSRRSFWSDVKKPKSTPTQDCNNKLIELINAKQINDVFLLYSDMRARNIRRNEETFTLLFSALKDTNLNVVMLMDMFSLITTDMVSMGYNISHTEIYNLLMVTIAARNEVQAVRDLFARMTSQNIPKTTLTYNTYLKVLAQHSTLKEMVSVFKQMQADKSGVQPDAETFNIFINYFAQTAEWTRMNQFYDLLVSSNIQPSEHTFEIILSAMQKRKLRAIWKYYYKFVSTRRQVSSNKIFKIVLQMWAGFPLTNKVTDFVKSISEDMKRLNAPITHSMFHEIMQYGQDEGHWRIVKNAYHFMVHCFGLKPTEETMKIMGTGTLVVTSNWREAVPWYLRELHVKQRFREYGMKPSEQIVKTISMIIELNKEEVHLLQWLYTFPNLRLPLKESTFSYIITTNISSGRLDEAQDWFQRMILSDIEPSTFTLQSILISYQNRITHLNNAAVARGCHGDKKPYSGNWFLQMEKFGIPANVHISLLLVEAYLKDEMFDRAWETYRYIMDFEESIPKTGNSVFAKLIEQCCAKKDTKKLVHILNDMYEHECLDDVSFFGVLKGLLISEKIIDAVTLMNNLQLYGLQCTYTRANTFVKIAAQTVPTMILVQYPRFFVMSGNHPLSKEDAKLFRKLLEELVGVKPPSDNSGDNNGSKFNSLDVFLARMLEGWLARVGLV